jgi:hypothetical protein
MMRDIHLKFPTLPQQKQHLTKLRVFLPANWKLQKLDHKYHERFKMWWWGSTEISRTGNFRNAVLQRVREDRHILHTIKIRKPN